MNRRRFLLRSLGAFAGVAAARWARAQSGLSSDTTTAAPPGAALRAPGPQILLTAGGDTTLGYNLQDHFDQQVAAGVPKERLWPLYFAGVRAHFEAADIALVNLECPFTERGKKLAKNFNFRARPELVRILQEGSVDVASLANNHTNDYGKNGVKDTLKTLDGAGIAHFGAGTNLEHARRPAVLERKGTKVGFLGWYFQADPDMLEPEAVYATRKRAGVAGCYKDLECVKRRIQEDVEELAPRVDAIVPYFHWGKEGSYEVRDYQIELAHLCVDLGCKAVLGAHPHRVQGVEVYKGAPIFYSLGNFVYGGIKEPKDTLTMMARIWLPARGALGAPAAGGSSAEGPGAGAASPAERPAVQADVVPVRFTRWPEAPFQPFVLEGTAYEEAMTRIGALCAGFERTLPCLERYRESAVAAPPDSSLSR